jgi:hypothetical protein
MKRQDALYVAMSVGMIAFAIGFVYPQLTEQAVAWYYPLERRWAYEVKPTGLAMDFFGRTAQALVAWAVVVAATLAIMPRIKRPLSPRVAGLLSAWAIVLTVLVILYFAWTLYFRHPTAAPIPDWYRPR